VLRLPIAPLPTGPRGRRARPASYLEAAKAAMAPEDQP